MINNKKYVSTKTSVAILGCGWVGKALESALLASGYVVHCLTRDIMANEKAGLYCVDVLVIAIPPRDNYLDVLEETLAHINVAAQVILLSSISFYDEKPLVVEAEMRVQKLHKTTVVLRLSGLMGYDRVAGKYTSGKVWDYDMRTNYVHRDDVVGVIASVIKSDISNEVFDVVAPQQSIKKEIFAQNAKQFGFNESTFLDSTVRGKVLTSEKLIERLDYTFIKEDVKEFWDTEKR